MNFGLTGTRVIDPERACDQVQDLWCREGVWLSSAQDDLPSTVGDGWVSGPALVDLYAQSGEPGFERRETLESLAQAARAGGYGALTLLPTTEPPLDRVTALQAMHTAYRGIPEAPKLMILGALSLGCRGEELVEAAAMAPLVVGFTDNQPHADWQRLRIALEYLRPWQRPIFVYPRQGALQRGTVAQESPLALSLGLVMSPVASETSGLQTLFELVALTGTPIHLMRLATAAGVDLVAQAKKQGLPITCSVAAIQLLATEAVLPSLDPYWRFEPALGSLKDQEALVEGIRTGVIDAIASDHTPWTYTEKTQAFTQAPPGAPMLEFVLPLLWHQLVVPGRLSAASLWRALSTQPAQILDPQRSRPWGWLAFDPEASWQVNAQSLQTRSPTTPWWGKTIRGKVQALWLNP